MFFVFFPIYRMIQRQRNNIVVSIIFEETHRLPLFTPMFQKYQKIELSSIEGLFF